MQQEIAKAIESGKLKPTHGDALARLTPGTYVTHRSWGFGQIEDLDFMLDQVTIHFVQKRGHTMKLQFAAETLVHIPADHIMARAAGDAEGTKTLAKKDPASLVRIACQNYGGKITQDQLQSCLVPGLMTEPEFKKWFTSAKNALRKDGHFAIPQKKTDPIVLHDTAVSHADEYIASYNNARQLKDQIAALENITKNILEFDLPAAQLIGVIQAVNDTVRKSQRLHPDQALTLILTRDELIEKVPALALEGAPSTAEFLSPEDRSLAQLLDGVPASKMKRAISGLPAAFGDNWPNAAIKLVLRGNSRIISEAARFMSESGKGEELHGALARAASEHSLTTDGLMWLCKERDGEFSEHVNHNLFHAILSSLERDQQNEKRERKLQDLLLSDQELIPDLISSSSAEELRELMRRLLITTVFEDLSKRSLLGRIIRLYPELGAMVSGESKEKEEALIVSWESMERRKQELHELTTKKIPENTKEIAIARSYGDLRENFEFKAAKEMQRVLMRRKAEMEIQLSNARGTDYSNPDTSIVSIGTIVHLRDSSGATTTYTILGAWDSDPEKNIVSYLAAIGAALLGKKVGDKLNLLTDSGEKEFEIVGIEAWKK